MEALPSRRRRTTVAEVQKAEEAAKAAAGLATNSNLFRCRRQKSLICLKGKSMTRGVIDYVTVRKEGKNIIFA